LWTLVAASSVGPTGHVFSFEPNPTTYKKLKENVGINCRESIVTAVPYAASDRNGAAWFSCPKNHSLSAIATDVMDRTDLVEVRTTTIDSLLQDAPQLNRVVGLKIDTEGHELSTLQGAVGVIRRLSPWLIVEFNTTLLDSKLMGDWPVYSFLCERNYCPFLYDSNSRTSIDGKFALDGYCNILFRKKTASSRVT
jgi:FkbM family methyltransferase